MRAVARFPVRVKLAVATVKPTLLLDTPPTVTTTPPVVAPVGTVATIDVALQFVIAVAVVPLNVTVLVPCVPPKFVPVIVTDAPTTADVGDRLVMLGAANKALDETTHTKMRTARRHLFLSFMLQTLLYSMKSIRDSQQSLSSQLKADLGSRMGT
jgi:hypothetical protein